MLIFVMSLRIVTEIRPFLSKMRTVAPAIRGSLLEQGRGALYPLIFSLSLCPLLISIYVLKAAVGLQIIVSPVLLSTWFIMLMTQFCSLPTIGL